MRKGIVLTAVALLAACLPAVARAQMQQVSLYDSGPARALGMGNAFTAVADDIESVLWNPAGLARVKAAQYAYADVGRSFPKSMRFAGYAQPGKDSPAGALSYLHVSNVPLGIKEQSLAYSFAQSLSPGFSIGVNIKYARFERADQGKELFNIDAGALYDLAPNISLGVAVLNATNPQILSAGSLPAAEAARLINTGVVFRLHPYVDAGLLGVAPTRYQTALAVEVFDALDEVNRQLRFGVEHVVSDRLTARAGLLSNTPTVGLGYRMQGYQLNAGVLIGRAQRRGTESMFSISSGF